MAKRVYFRVSVSIFVGLFVVSDSHGCGRGHHHAMDEDGDVARDVLKVFGRPKMMNPPFEGCKKGAYPPKHIYPPPETYTIDLDLPPEYRWTKLVEDKGEHIRVLLSSLKNYTSSLFGGKLFGYIDKFMPILGNSLPSPFREEIQGASYISGIPFGELVLYNVFYEIFSVCTSILAQTPGGEVYHARNLDFGLFLGWDDQNQTWLTTEYLRPLVVHLVFTKRNQTLFESVNFAGYIGVLTGMKKNSFSLTVNERFNLKGGFIGILEWILGTKDIHWLGFLTREVMENATDYEGALKLLRDTPLLAPAYYILGGSAKGQGCVITRGLNKARADVWSLGEKDWYLVQTNYDHWKDPPFWDDRRGPAIECMDTWGQGSLGFESLYNVLSTRPILNKLTTYTTLMQVGRGSFEVNLRDCDSPCWPW